MKLPEAVLGHPPFAKLEKKLKEPLSLVVHRWFEEDSRSCTEKNWLYLRLIRADHLHVFRVFL